MTKRAKKLFVIRVENPSPKEGEKQWLTVGNASLVDGQFGEVLACRITTIPLVLLQQGLSNWGGTFIVTEIKDKRDKKEEDNREES